MENIHTEIAGKIRDGSYYKDAREWYARHYLFPITERSFLIITTAVLTVMFTISVMNISLISGVSEEIPFPIKIENTTDYFPYIKPIAEQSDDTQSAVARYLISEYIKAREEYSYHDNKQGKLKQVLKHVKSSSAKEVLDEYQNYMSVTNPYSPIIRYGDNIERTIEIKSFKFLSGDRNSGKVAVKFEAGEKERGKKDIQKTMWEATVHFRLPDIETIARTGAPLRFLVKYYRVKLLS